MSTVEGGGRKWQDLELELTQPQGGQQLGVKVFDQKTSRTFTELFTLAKVTTSGGKTLFVNRRSLRKFLDRNKSTAEDLGIKRCMWTSTIVDKLTEKSQKNFEKKFKMLYTSEDVDNPEDAVKQFIRECGIGNEDRANFAKALKNVLNTCSVNSGILKALIPELKSCLGIEGNHKFLCGLNQGVFSEVCDILQKNGGAEALYEMLMAVCKHGSSPENLKIVAQKVGDVSSHKEPYTYTPLTLAIKYKQKEVVAELLNVYTVDPLVQKGQWHTNRVNQRGLLFATVQSPLVVALESGDEEIIDLIMKKEAGRSFKYYENLLEVALTKGCSLSTIQKLLNHDRVEVIRELDIMYAITKGDPEILKCMLEHSKAKDLQLENGRLDEALKKLGSCNQKDEPQYREIIKLLLECKKLKEESLPDWDVRMVSKDQQFPPVIFC